VDADLVAATVQDVLQTFVTELGSAYAESRFPLAASLFQELMTAPTCPEWLTVAAYAHLD
jgi:hypothetical protein